MIDTTKEVPIPLAPAARHLPPLRSNRPVSPSTLWRWAKRGLRGVCLEIIHVGGTVCTSREALQRFFAALSHTPLPVPHTQGRDEDRHKAVEAELDSMGLACRSR